MRNFIETIPPGGPEKALGTPTRTNPAPTPPNVADGPLERRELHLHFDTLPPKHTRQAQTRLAVVNGRARSYKTRAQREQEGNLLALVVGALPEGFAPFAGPVAVRIRMVSPYRATEKKRVVRSCREVPNVSRPDLDNVAVKPLLDVLEQAQVFARGDAQVCELSASKWWGPRGWWGVDVVELDENGEGGEA